MFLRLLINQQGRDNRDNFSVWTDLTSEWLETNWTSSDSEGSNIDVFSFEIQDKDNSVDLEVGSEVILEGSSTSLTNVAFGTADRRLFGGLLTQPVRIQDGLGRVWSCSAQDWKLLLDRAVVTKDYTNKKDWWIIRDAFKEAYDDLEDTVLEKGYLGNELNLDGYGLYDNSSPLEDITQLDLGPGSAGGRYPGNDIDQASFEGQSLRSLIDVIASQVGNEWTVDPFKNFWYYPITATEVEAPFHLSADPADDGNSNYSPFYGAKYFQEIGQFNVLQIRGSRGFSKDPVENYYSADGQETSFELSQFESNADFVEEDQNLQLSRPIIAGFPYFLPQYTNPGSFAFVEESLRGEPGIRLPLIQIIWASTASLRTSHGQEDAYEEVYSLTYGTNLPDTPPDTYYTFPVNRVFASELELRNAPRSIRNGHHVIVDLFTSSIEFFNIRPIETPQRLFFRQPAHSWKAWGRYSTSVRFIERDSRLIERSGGRIFVRSISDPNVKSAEDAARVATVFFKKQGAQFRISGRLTRDGLQAGHRLQVIHPAFDLDSSDEFVVRNIKTKQIGKNEVTLEPELEYSVTLGTNIGSYQEYSRQVRTATKSAASQINQSDRSIISQFLTSVGDATADPLPDILRLSTLSDIIINPQAETACVSAAILNRGNTDFTIYYRYRKTADDVWINGASQSVVHTETKLVLMELESNTEYIVQVSTDPEFNFRIQRTFDTLVSRPFNPPYFEEGHVITRSVNEGVAVGSNVGNPISAMDPTTQTLTYTLSGVDASSFSISSSTGQLTTVDDLDYSVTNEYRVRVTVSDGTNDVEALVVINVVNTNQDGEISFSTIYPRVNLRLTARLSDPDERINPLAVSWTWERSANDNGPWLTFRTHDEDTEDSYVIPAQVEGDYVRVSAEYSDAFGPGQIARSVSQNTIAAESDAALPPEFIAPYEFEIEEDADIDDVVGTVQANSPGNLTIAYTLEGTEAAGFAIENNGQILVDSSLDYETKAEYNFQVRATDSNNEFTGVDVRVNVLDVDEPPSRMDTPTLGSRSRTSLTIEYTTPDTDGPPVTSYNVRVSNPRAGTSVVENSTGLIHTITNLVAGTAYVIEVAGVNAEGTGEYSTGLEVSTVAAPTTPTGSTTFSLGGSISFSGNALSYSWSGSLAVSGTKVVGSSAALTSFSISINIVTQATSIQLGISSDLISESGSLGISTSSRSASIPGPTSPGNISNDSTSPYSWSVPFSPSLASLLRKAFIDREGLTLRL